MKSIFYFIGLYLAILFVFRFLLPMGVAIFKMRKGIKELKKRMQEQQDTQFQGFTNSNESQSFQKVSNSPKTDNKKKEDYLDFEEIKE